MPMHDVDLPKVLVVDDEDVLVDMLATIIDDLGYQPIKATNGKEAWALLSARKPCPDLIIADVMMPQMSGVELARAVREEASLRDVPIILMSAAGRPPGNHLADQFIHKPFDLDTLIDLIERYVEKR